MLKRLLMKALRSLEMDSLGPFDYAGFYLAQKGLTLRRTSAKRTPKEDGIENDIDLLAIQIRILAGGKRRQTRTGEVVSPFVSQRRLGRL